jgi:hypothetical protein
MFNFKPTWVSIVSALNQADVGNFELGRTGAEKFKSDKVGAFDISV